MLLTKQVNMKVRKLNRYIVTYTYAKGCKGQETVVAYDEAHVHEMLGTGYTTTEIRLHTDADKRESFSLNI